MMEACPIPLEDMVKKMERKTCASPLCKKEDTAPRKVHPSDCPTGSIEKIDTFDKVLVCQVLV